MNILLGFAPFLAFAVLDRLVGPLPGMLASAIVSAALTGREVLLLGRSPKVLEVGTLMLFVGLAVYTLLASPAWSTWGVRLCVDAGLLGIVLASIALGRPFTLQYAREQVAPGLWASPGFVRTNYAITTVWALAFAVMVAADLVMVARPDLPQRVSVLATVLALAGAAKFTGWYPERARLHAAG